MKKENCEHDWRFIEKLYPMSLRDTYRFYCTKCLEITDEEEETDEEEKTIEEEDDR